MSDDRKPIKDGREAHTRNLDQLVFDIRDECGELVDHVTSNSAGDADWFSVRLTETIDEQYEGVDLPHYVVLRAFGERFVFVGYAIEQSPEGDDFHPVAHFNTIEKVADLHGWT